MIATLLTLRRATHSASISVRVGDPNPRTFAIPKGVLCEYSWFANALKDGCFTEGETQVIKLPDDFPQAFGYFYYYIYHKDVAFTETPEDDGKRRRHVHELCETWVFGDKYGIPGLQNCAMMRLCQVLSGDRANDSTSMTLDTMRLCYERTVADSPLRKIVSEYIVFTVEYGQGRISDYGSLANEQGFLEDVYESKGAFDEHHGTSSWPRYRRPYKNHDLYEVKVSYEDMASIPYASRAYWRTGQPVIACDHCGKGGAEQCCNEGPPLGFSSSGCACCGGDVVRLCHGCQRDEGIL